MKKIFHSQELYRINEEKRRILYLFKMTIPTFNGVKIINIFDFISLRF